MLRTNVILSLILCASLVACQAPTATPYQPLKQNEGYTDRKISADEYEIQVRGNNLTTPPTLKNHFDRRAEELCGSSRFKTTLTLDQYTNVHDPVNGNAIYAPPSYSNTHVITGVVKCER